MMLAHTVWARAQVNEDNMIAFENAPFAYAPRYGGFWWVPARAHLGAWSVTVRVRPCGCRCTLFAAARALERSVAPAAPHPLPS